MNTPFLPPTPTPNLCQKKRIRKVARNYEVKDSSLSCILLWSALTRTVEKRYIGAEIN